MERTAVGGKVGGSQIVGENDDKIHVSMGAYRYEYPGDLKFEDLIKELSEFLGGAWKEKPKNDGEGSQEERERRDEAVKIVLKREGVVGLATLVNPAFPGQEVFIFQKREEIDGKVRCMVTVGIIPSDRSEPE